ncbi:GntR family transcriptional repressor for pyruvate dehydrogenase complex [Microbacterium resistens]|uniref:GntR family transcriptional repressor for pyruvate dehydrogenase complex n=1 Tax=Microbacterium resistens TaxID=156977 RepID=A0ABU1SCQ7_9MICO|nr:FCD domain-containing protein [Microbacterium resistens]MDR6867366.1 GntR family transcriptional repressor for pyruvate dehydrogenase complex [Microbacterium resistens]
MMDSPLVDAALHPVRGHMAFESCVEQLGSAIQLGIFRVGTKLPGERELAERLNVSRATLREAISALRAAGLVSTTRGRGGGTVVEPLVEAWPSGQAVPRRAEIEDISVFRSVIEPGAAYRAARTALDASQRALLETSLADLAAAETPADYRQADARLHLAISTVCGSDELARACSGVQTKIHQFLAEIPFLKTNIEHSEEEHRAVVAAILAGEAERARDIMAAHCDATTALLKGLLK